MNGVLLSKQEPAICTGHATTSLVGAEKCECFEQPTWGRRICQQEEAGILGMEDGGAVSSPVSLGLAQASAVCLYNSNPKHFT